MNLSGGQRAKSRATRVMTDTIGPTIQYIGSGISPSQKSTNAKRETAAARTSNHRHIFFLKRTATPAATKLIIATVHNNLPNIETTGFPRRLVNSYEWPDQPTPVPDG